MDNPIEPATGAPADDLDALMDQFTAASTSATGEAEAAPPISPEERQQYHRELEVLGERQEQFRSEVSSYEYQRAEEQTKKELSDLVKEVRGDLNPAFFDDGMVQAWVDNEARANPKLQAIWLNRANDPASLRLAVSTLAKEFHKKYSRMPDPVATEDREFVTAAMLRGGLAKAPADAPPDYSRMSNADFRKNVRDQYGFEAGI